MKKNIYHLALVNSTNSYAKEHASDFDRDALTIITADEQRAGRGREGRSWVSPSHQSILATFCHFTPMITNFSQILSLATCHLLKELRPQIKWPNDILIGEKKIAGVLCELTQMDNQYCVMNGVGININMPLEVCQQIDQPATSLFVETGKEQSLKELLSSLTSYYDSLLSLPFETLFPDIEKHLLHKKGDTITVRDQGKQWKGIFESLNTDGSLSVEIEGETRKFYSGVTF